MCTLITEEVLQELEGAEPHVLEQAQSVMGDTWLCYEVHAGSMALGCSVCRPERGMQFTSREQCALARLKRHAAGAEHVRNVCALRGHVKPRPVAEVQWPGKENFLQVFRQLSKNTCDRVVDGVAAQRKTAKMEWCLVEARRQKWREQLRGAVAIALLRDERHKRMLVRFRCVDSKLRVTNGVIGQLNPKSDYSSTSAGLVAATHKLLREFCTPLLGKPGAKDEEFSVDEQLLHHIRHRVFSTTVDSADIVVAAVQDSAAPLEAEISSLPAGETLFPQHILVVRERAHGSRRVLQRRNCKSNGSCAPEHP